MAAHESPRTTKLYDRTGSPRGAVTDRQPSSRPASPLTVPSAWRARADAFGIWRQETCVHQATASPDTPS